MGKLDARSSLLRRAMQLNGRVIGLTLGLCLIGFVMLYSAAGGSFDPWLAPQLLRFIPGFMLMLFIAIMPQSWLTRGAYPFYLFCILLLLWVEVSGDTNMGAQRWVGVGGMTLQPSELMKIGLILVLARYFHRVHPENVSHLLSLVIPLLLIAVPAVLILRQPNLGTTAILGFIGVVMLFMAGIHWRYFAIAGGAGIIAAPILWQFLHDYQKRRILTFLDPGEDPLGAGYNITQSMIAIGSGGFFGKGLLNGSQGQLNFLPEKQTDFIFTMLAEEFGFTGAFITLLCYGGLLAASLFVGVRSRNSFGALLAAGVCAMLFIHIFVNIGMVMGMMPVVGVPLPFLSYGGSFLIATLLSIGLLLNAYVHRDVALERGGRLV